MVGALEVRQVWMRGLCAAGLLILVGGCGSGDAHPTAAVQGKVLHNGQPVADAVVSFTPQAGAASSNQPGKSATGRTDATGTFTLSTYQIGDGAIVGTHQVTVSSEDPNQPLPGQAAKDLTLEVKPGTNDFQIELES